MTTPKPSTEGSTKSTTERSMSAASDIASALLAIAQSRTTNRKENQ
jgi:hypothetical protein